MSLEPPLANPLFACIFLLASSLLSGVYNAFQRLGELETDALFAKNLNGSLFQLVLKTLAKERQWRKLLFSIHFTKGIFQLCYAVSAFFFLLYSSPFEQALTMHETGNAEWNVFWILLILGSIIGIYLFVDFIFSLFAINKSKLFLTLFFPLTAPLLLLSFPFSLFFLRSFNLNAAHTEEKVLPASFRIRDKILEFLNESHLSEYLDPNDQALILSIASFKDRVAREVMVPRIAVFSLSAETTIEEAAKSFLEQGYSRIPVYRDSVDHIIGVLLYKDVLNVYAKQRSKEKLEEELKSAIETLVKPVVYTPETKKISLLLQEFKSKQSHLAIVVDEYGGTEGILTIEDILEELVGEIADEYDIGDEEMFTPLPTGGWIVDPKMNIFYIEEELGIKIPEGMEYDTIGGYIFHRAGSIPAKGWRIHHDKFDLEVLASTERAIEKIKITPHTKPISPNHPKPQSN